MVEVENTRFQLSNGFALSVNIGTRIPRHGQGDDKLVDLILVHGGPGVCDQSQIFPHFCSQLLHLPNVDRLISYDQLGSGESDKPNDDSLYSLDYFVKELEEVITHVRSSSRTVLLGHSWGGQLTLEYLCRHQQCQEFVEGAVISNSNLTEKSYELIQRRIHNAQEEGFRSWKEMEEIEMMNSGSVESLVFRTLVGENDRTITGSLRDWTVMNRLELLKSTCPLLFVAGEHDTVNIEELSAAAQFTGARLLIIEGGEHAPFFEKASVPIYFAEINEFILSLAC